jgi:hypothetical protein
MVFEHYDYEAQGGVGDCEKDFDDRSEAIEYAEDKAKNGPRDNVELFDRVEGVILLDKDFNGITRNYCKEFQSCNKCKQ